MCKNEKQKYQSSSSKGLVQASSLVCGCSFR